MTISESISKSLLHELDVIQHLYTKLDPAKADWRPQENMRSTLELLRYLTSIGYSTVRHFVNPLPTGDLAMAPLKVATDQASTLTFEEIPAAFEREREAIREAMSSVTDEDLTKTTWYPWGGPEMTLSYALINASTKYLAAYRMQLFLYAKLCGAEIGTANNWRGVDATPAPVVAAAQ